MPTQKEGPSKIVLSLPGRKESRKTLPSLLKTDTRSTASGEDRFVSEQVVQVAASFDLSAKTRSTGEAETTSPDARQLIALEAEDGTTLFIRADKLEEDLLRLYPEAVKDGKLDLDVLAGREAAARGLGDWFWSRLSVLTLGRDDIIRKAEEKAREWLADWLQDKFTDAVEKAGLLSASWLGAKALMWAIESRLNGEPGLYSWRGGELAPADRRQPDDPDLVKAAEKGLLVFIHGTGSHTLGAFKDLGTVGRKSDWAVLTEEFGNRIFGFEHRTFSESPIDNALALAETLPPKAKISLVTHSRGGLVGDLICLQNLSEDLIQAYRRDPLSEKEEKPWEKVIRERAAAEEQKKLHRLVMLLEQKDFRIERYVRVACPAGGTTLLSANLDVFLSGLLSLTNALVGAVLGPGASPVLSAFKRIVLEIAEKRLEPWLVPGIEAMLTDAPMAALLARATRKPGISMGVIAGDIEGGGLIKRIGVMFTDWMFFDRADNDLVVDTASMYAGLAGAPGTRYLFDQGDKVNHFNYFQNRRTLRGLQAWLKTDPLQLNDLDDWTPIEALGEPKREVVEQARAARSASRGEPRPDSRPVVFLLPGIMGSHLEVRSSGRPGSGDRVWFDVFDIARGGFKKIRRGAPAVEPECLFEMFYGALADYLEATHWVIRYPYDWRLTVQEAADALAVDVEKALDRHPSQPVRLLAHSMGGLVARAMIAGHGQLWERIVKHRGGRLVMMGTPNNGSHLMVETLLGKSGTIRKLAVMDAKHRLQGLLDIVAGFPGALQLLPRPGFRDAGGAQTDDYYTQTPWQDFQRINRDRWFGDGVCGVPAGDVLKNAGTLWTGGITEERSEGEGWRHRPILPAERVAYVFGQSENTPCGVKVEGKRLMMVGTSEGDGSVTWASGRLDFLPENRCWHMPVDHGSLTKTRQYFPDICDLLETGVTTRLGRLPVTRGAAATRTYDAGPVTYPTPEDVTHSFMGTRPVLSRPAPRRRTLRIQVRAMDLRHSQMPVICGHYIGDPIAGAESQIDQYLVGGKLRHRERLGVYAGDIGTAALVVDHELRSDRRRAAGKGAIIVGLGELGRLTTGKLTETVRAGVLRYLLLAADRIRQDDGSDAATDPQVKLGSVLIGYNSTVNIGVEDSVAAVVCGVCEANRQFEDAVGPVLRVDELEFVELFLDTAISAAKVVRNLSERLERDLKRLEIDIDTAKTLLQGESFRTRLSVNSGFGYWPRMIVTDADRPETECPPECYRVRRVSPIPATLQKQLVEELTGSRKPADEDAVPSKSQAFEPTSTALAERMKFVFLSERARAEAIVVQRQPGLAETLIRQAIRSDRYQPDLARTLFQLLVPLDFKEASRDAAQMILVLDGYTANLPWEMLCGEQEPMVIKTAVVRQLESTRFRRAVQSTTRKTACVIADPSTNGFEKHFVMRSEKPLPLLPGAVEEGERVRDLLTDGGYEVVYAPSETEALDVFNKLFQSPHRILVIAAHGVFEAEARGGGKRTGVVLSDGMLLTAAEVGQMEIVPEVVFLNCCHLGQVDAAPAYNRLAYSLSRELIEMGVRCVVAAGWAVNDQAAVTFAATFFEWLVKRGDSFGRAVHAARKATYESHPAFNTWGAYQAYGDPGFVLEHDRVSRGGDRGGFVAPQELIEDLGWIRSEIKFSGIRDLEKTRGEIDATLTRGAPGWGDLPAVQAAIGAIYAEFGPKGFETARAAYLRAIAEEDRAGMVPVKTIEQLANLEARIAETLHDDPEQGLALVDQAIARLEKLFMTTAKRPPAEFADLDGSKTEVAAERPNLERWSLLGSALKRKAALQVKLKKPAAAVRKTLVASRDAYARCEGRPEDAAFNPYAMINRLQFDALLGEEDRTGRIALARQCEAAAEKRFAASYDFFDAVMAVDAQVAERLLTGTLVAAADELVKAFKETFSRVPGSERMRDSVLKQVHLMGGFFGVLAGGITEVEQREKIRSMAESLGLIAAELEAFFSSGEPGETTAASTKPEGKGAVAIAGQRRKAAKAAPKSRAPRSAKGARKKGKGK
ncbi:MAG: CHAT domain-containing protein [Desulfobacterales bacterium]